MLEAMFYYRCGPKRSNFGDLVGPWLYEKIKGNAPIAVDERTCRTYRGERLLVTCGSLIQNWNMQGNWHIWGSGIYRSNERLTKRPGKVHAVRGPLSRALLLRHNIACPEVYGDPALLLPRFYAARRNKHTYRVGVVPHYSGYESTKRMFADRNDVFVIDVDRPVEQVCDDIASCEVTIAASLHGVIVSHAYGIDCAWSERLGQEARPQDRGDGVKYRDYYASVGVNDIAPINIADVVNKPLDNIVAAVRAYPQPAAMPDLDALLAACPF